LALLCGQLCAFTPKFFNVVYLFQSCFAIIVFSPNSLFPPPPPPGQIFLWEQNLEQFHMDLFRYRCYLSSLQGGELPNPKRLLAFASRPTKLAMGRLGIFSVSSFHALVRLTANG